MAANFRRYAAAAWALLLGFGMWAGSRFVVGTLEPWDAEWPFYLVIMLAGGAAIGVALPRQTVPMFLGLWAGQALGLLLPGHDRSWFLLGCVTTGDWQPARADRISGRRGGAYRMGIFPARCANERPISGK